MGRTGRHREGRVVYLLAQGREHEQYLSIEEVRGVGVGPPRVVVPGREHGQHLSIEELWVSGWGGVGRISALRR